MQGEPQLIETRSQVLHGQEVEVKVYGPGGTHHCDRGKTIDIPPCPICRSRGRDYDADRKGFRLEGIERRWPVALGITEGYHEPISGTMEYEAPPCAFRPPRIPPAKPEPKGCFVREVDRQGIANATFARANELAKARRIASVKHAPWTPEARAARGAYLKRLAKERAEWDRHRAWQHEQRKAARERREKGKILCQAGECDLGGWTALDRGQFRELFKRSRAEYETGLVRGCDHCPRIDIETRPHSEAL